MDGEGKTEAQKIDALVGHVVTLFDFKVVHIDRTAAFERDCSLVTIEVPNERLADAYDKWAAWNALFAWNADGEHE